MRINYEIFLKSFQFYGRGQKLFYPNVETFVEE